MIVNPLPHLKPYLLQIDYFKNVKRRDSRHPMRSVGGTIHAVNDELALTVARGDIARTVRKQDMLHRALLVALRGDFPLQREETLLEIDNSAVHEWEKSQLC